MCQAAATGDTDLMLITEELVLLALDPEKGNLVNSSATNLKVGVVGAAVAQLALDGRVEMQGKRFVATGAAPEDPVLRDVHRALADRKGRRAKDQLRRLDKAAGGVWRRTLDGLVAQGAVEARRELVLLFPVTRYPVRDVSAQRRLVDALRDAARTDGELDPRIAALLSLCGPCRLLEVVAPERSERRHAKRRIAEATDRTPVAPVVKAVIQETQAAVAAGVIAATAATTAAGS
jgi:hypothetical protein